MRRILSLLYLLGHSDPYAVANLNRRGLNCGDFYRDTFGHLDPDGITNGNINRAALRAALGRHARPGAIQRHHRGACAAGGSSLRDTGGPVAETLT